LLRQKNRRKPVKSHLKIISTGALLLALSPVIYAGTLDEVKSLWDPQGITGAAPAASAGVPASEKPVSQVRWYRLSNGRQVNLSDWKVVLFMQGTARTATSLTRS
jgi:hypothetical protein